MLSLDLLGTRAGTADETLKYLQVTRDALARASRGAQRPGGSTTLVRWFSDNVALADPLERDGDEGFTFGLHLATTAWMQLELAGMGFFSRGGIAVGEFYADETFLYGPALVDAYETESKAAIYPRALLSKGAAQFALDDLGRQGGARHAIHRSHLAIDRDGLVFVNYLAEVLEEPGDAEALLLNHRRHVDDGLDAHRGDPHVHLKYVWLADYHDRFCRTHFQVREQADLFFGAMVGPTLRAFGEQIALPEPPPDTGLGF